MQFDIVIIGAGISGLTTASSLQENGVQHVLIIDYQQEIGGFASPFFHQSAFAREKQKLEQAKSLSYEIWTQATVIGFFPGEEGSSHQLFIQTESGTRMVEAKRVVIAAGALEKPREAHKIAGPRPAGVMTPTMVAGLLQRGYLPGECMAVYHSGRLTEGAAGLLAEHGCQTQSFSAADWEVVAVEGQSRLCEVSFLQRKDQTLVRQPCDTLIFAQGRIPSTFFLKGTPVIRDEQHAIVIDEWGNTNLEGIYATGSCTSLGDDDHLNSIDLAEKMVSGLLSSL